MKYVCVFLIRLYQKWISPLKRPCCRFSPTCSAYSVEAYLKRGFFAGSVLTVLRLLRCQPFGRGGYDPVPEKGFKRIPLDRKKEIPSPTPPDPREGGDTTSL